ncbi:P1 family peptidase [Endozoicomonas sp. SESOKO1]|uniref:P1 family peptidase n=1 Tax=Endozoicomonas sp. SESOKO1 TaxID=2828742 RepID=UPI0021493C63|nr:P1 family peptidase [Endozoicomonas sp. SESOKO1]
MTTRRHELFDIRGLAIGHASDPEGLTGVTVLRFDQGATAGVDVRGAAPGTRETELLRPENLVNSVHAIVLCGGSAPGLASMNGVSRYLEEQGIGLPTGFIRIPIVTGAVLFDQSVGDASVRPGEQMGYEATRLAGRQDVAEGNVGAGTGASIGKIAGFDRATKSGIGCDVIKLGKGLVVAAVVAVNAWGDVVAGEKLLAGTRSEDGQRFVSGMDILRDDRAVEALPGTNTTIGVVVTNAKLTKAQALKVAQMGHDGLSRAIRPAHSMYDGDTIFSAATGEVEADVNVLGIMGAEVVEQAIYRAIYTATAAGGLPAIHDITG